MRTGGGGRVVWGSEVSTDRTTKARGNLHSTSNRNRCRRHRILRKRNGLQSYNSSIKSLHILTASIHDISNRHASIELLEKIGKMGFRSASGKVLSITLKGLAQTLVLAVRLLLGLGTPTHGVATSADAALGSWVAGSWLLGSADSEGGQFLILLLEADLMFNQELAD
jgi:hypothetical protein